METIKLKPVWCCGYCFSELEVTNEEEPKKMELRCKNDSCFAYGEKFKTPPGYIESFA